MDVRESLKEIIETIKLETPFEVASEKIKSVVIAAEKALDIDIERERIHVCGVTCHPGDENCNHYCNDDAVRRPKTYFGRSKIDNAQDTTVTWTQLQSRKS